jgi:hypothetical protein
VEECGPMISLTEYEGQFKMVLSATLLFFFSSFWAAPFD